METKKKKKIWKGLLIGVMLIIAISFVGDILLKKIITQKFNTALQQFAPVVQANYSDIHINLLSASLDIDSLSIQYRPEPGNQPHKHAVYFSSVSIHGINYFKLLAGKNFGASSLQLNNALVKLDRYLLDKKDTVAARILSSLKLPFENLSFGRIDLSNAVVKEINEKHETTLLNGDLTIKDINLSHVDSAFSANNIHFSNIEGALHSIAYTLPANHTIHIKKLNLNSRDSSLHIDSCSVQYHPGPANDPHKHDVYFPSVSVRGINYSGLFSGKDLSVSSLQLNNGRVKLDGYLLDKKDAAGAGILSSIKLPFENLSIGRLVLSNAAIKEINGKHETTLLNGDLTIKDLSLSHVDSAFSADSIHFSNIECALRNITYALPGYRTLHIKKIKLSSKESLMQIDSLVVTSTLGKLELGQRLGHQADHINAVIKGITITGLDVLQLRKKKFNATDIIIHQSVTNIFRDRRLPRQLKVQQTPGEYLKQMPADIYVKHFKLEDATFTSEEFPKTGDKSGFIKITGISITMEPFFNRATKGRAVLTSHVKGNIMSAGGIHATIDLSLLTGNEDIKGAIENLDLPALNPSAENLGKFHVRSGILNNLSFAFVTTPKKATGKIIGEYHDMVIDKLTKDGKKTASLPTFALHAFIIPKNKDASLPEKKRTGKIDYDRDPTRFITFFYIKALLDGVRDSFSLGFLLPK